MRRLALPLLLAVCLPILLPAQAPPPQIQPDVFGFEAIIGTAFSQQFTVANPPSGGINGGWAISAGSLPAGISLTSAGLLSGSPTTPQSATFTVTTVYTFPFTSFVVPPLYLNRSYYFNTDAPFSILTTSPLPAATAGTSMTRAISASAFAGWDTGASTLPQTISYVFPIEAGPSMSITGTFPDVTAPTTYSFLVYASGGNYVAQSANRNFSITVNPAPVLAAALPAAVMSSAYSGSLSVTGGTSPFIYSLLTGALPPGLTLTPSTGAVSGTPTALGTFNFSAQVRDVNNAVSTRTLSITVNAAILAITGGTPPGGMVDTPYSFAFSATGGTGGNTWSIGTGTLPPGLALNAASGVVSGAPSQHGQFGFTVTVRDSQGNTASANYFLAIVPAPLSVLEGTLPEGTTGVSYGTSIAALGGIPPFIFDVTAGATPPGIALSAGGILSGIPSQPGTFPFIVRVTDSLGTTASAQFLIRVVPGQLVISTTSLPDGTAGMAYSAGLLAFNGVAPYTWSVPEASLPPGLALAAQGGILSGTPSQPGTFSFTVTVADSSGGTASRSLSVRVVEPLRFTTGELPGGTEGTPYSAALAAAGGASPYVFSLTQGDLPPGLSLASNGSITGAPTATGNFSFTGRVADSAGRVSDGVFVIAVTRTAITTENLPAGRVGTAYDATLAASGQPPFTWAVTAGSLPAGLTLNPATGIVSGTPTTAGTSAFTVTVSDGNAPPLTASREFTLTISLPPVPPLDITQLDDTTPPASQPSFGLQLARTFDAELDGTASLVFTPDGDLPPDPDVRFSSGATAVNFTIAAGQGSATPASGSQFAFQTGTTAGAITLAVTLRLGDTVLDPNPYSTRTIRIAPAPPTITSVRIVRNATGFDILVSGYSNTRAVTGAAFRFTPAPGSSLQTTDVTVPVQSVFQNWFSSADSRGFGGQFLLTVPFTLQGNAGAIASVQVTLTNGIGSSNASANF